MKQITFSKFGEHGRLGNQLWQYAFLKAYQLKTGYDVFLPPLNGKIWHGQECLMNYFNLTLPEKTYQPTLSWELYPELDPQEFNPNVYDRPHNVDFLGFFQNTKYFQGFEEEIKKEFSLKPWLDKLATQEIERIRQHVGNKQIVSLHIRRGDVVEQTKDMNFFDKPDGIWFIYWEMARNYFKEKNVCFLVFTGGSRQNEYEADLKWCWDNVNAENVLIADTRNPILDFALITKCDHNIMSHASSFSYWSSYLNMNPEKIVIAPKYYFIDRRDRFIEGFYPPEFTLI